ncbi:MAG TPA: hypothetical protein VGK35_06630 [Actinotalea sp.]|jgi:hypothetical protein
MSHRLLRPRWLLLASVAAVITVAFSSASLLSRHASFLVHQCVPVDGTAGWLGIRLALLRPDAACPTGALAVGGDARHMLGVVVVVAVPALVGHLAGILLGLGLLSRLRQVTRTAVDVVRRALPRAVDAPIDLPVVRRLPAVTRSLVLLPGRAADVPWRRGPPALQLV